MELFVQLHPQGTELCNLMLPSGFGMMNWNWRSYTSMTRKFFGKQTNRFFALALETSYSLI